MSSPEELEATLHQARALILADLHAREVADATVVSLVEDAVAYRRWWLEQWPEGNEFVLGLVAQDVQDKLLEEFGRWPLCTGHAAEGDPHALSVEPELGPEPHWVCGKEAVVVAPVGSLGAA